MFSKSFQLFSFASLMPAAVVDRIGWVLMHSIWQFAFLALAALVIMRVLQRSAATNRYAVLLTAMGGFAICREFV